MESLTTSLGYLIVIEGGGEIPYFENFAAPRRLLESPPFYDFGNDFLRYPFCQIFAKFFHFS